jgi:hypothetical protein
VSLAVSVLLIFVFLYVGCFIFVIVVLLPMVGPTCMIFEASSSVKISIIMQITVIVVTEKRTATTYKIT